MRRTAKYLATLFALVALSLSQAVAADGFYTGASFVSDETQFANGYAWGVVASWLAFPGVETPENIEKIGDCLAEGNVTSGVFADAVRATIRQNPALLPVAASQAALNTLYAICPVR